MPSNVSLLAEWNEREITSQLQQLRAQQPEMIPHKTKAPSRLVGASIFAAVQKQSALWLQITVGLAKRRRRSIRQLTPKLLSIKSVIKSRVHPANGDGQLVEDGGTDQHRFLALELDAAHC
jgi:hypothetical protein